MVQLLNMVQPRATWNSWTIVLCLLIPLQVVWSNPLETHLKETAELEEEAVWEQLDYNQLLGQDITQSAQNYAQLQQLIEQHKRNAGLFFLHFSEQHLQQYPIDYQQKTVLQQYYQLGAFLKAQEGRFFAIANDLIFSNLAEALTKGFKAEKLHKSDAEIMDLVEKLKAEQYGVSIPVSNYEKGIYHLKQGNIGYILNRLWLDHPLLCILGALLGLMSLWGLWRLFKRFKASKE